MSLCKRRFFMRKDTNYFAINNKKTPFFYLIKCDINVISRCKI